MSGGSVHSVNGMKVVVTPVASSIDLLKLSWVTSALPLARQGKTDTGIATTAHYVAGADLTVLTHSLAYGRIKDAVEAHFGFRGVKCNRVAYREMVYGDHFEYHRDSVSEGRVTAVLYLNDEWSESYRGELLFLGADDVGLSVLPRPGRAVIFDSRLKHASSPPSRLYYGSRRVVVFNLADG